MKKKQARITELEGRLNQINEEYARTKKALREYREKCRELIEAIQDVYFEISDRGIITEISLSVQKVLKHQKDALIGRPINELFVRREDGDWFLREVIRTGRVQKFETMLKGGGGTQVYCMIQATRKHDDPDKTSNITGTIHNITEQKETEKELRQSQYQLHQSQKMETLGTLVAGMAHEINNPINLIMYNIPLLKKVWKDLTPVLEAYAANHPDDKFGGLTFDFLNQNLGQLLQDVDMAANRIAEIVLNLKNFARQSDVAEKKPIHINEAIDNAMRLVRTTLKKAKVDIELNLASRLPPMEGNLHNIEQIILNIIINAIQAIDHDQGLIKISTRIIKADRRIQVTIEDNGKGINPGIADRLFEPFVTDKQTEGGTGLGLSVTYSLVKAHNGEISFQPGPDKRGTVFTLYFPTILKIPATKILVVDDDKNIRELLTLALTTQRPFLVNEASNGIEACIKLGSYRPSLLILDIFMPDMNGLEVCRTIKNDPGLSDIKVIITTGYPDHPILTEVNALGFTNITYKPLQIKKFIEYVDHILAG